MDWKRFIKGETYKPNEETIDDSLNTFEQLDEPSISSEINKPESALATKDYYYINDLFVYRTSNKKVFRTDEFKYYSIKIADPYSTVMYADLIQHGKDELTMFTKWTPLSGGVIIIDQHDVHYISLGKKLVTERFPIAKISGVEDNLNFITIYIGSRKMKFKTTKKSAKLIRKNIQTLKIS